MKLSSSGTALLCSPRSSLSTSSLFSHTSRLLHSSNHTSALSLHQFSLTTHTHTRTHVCSFWPLVQKLPTDSASRQRRGVAVLRSFPSCPEPAALRGVWGGVWLGWGVFSSTMFDLCKYLGLKQFCTVQLSMCLQVSCQRLWRHVGSVRNASSLICPSCANNQD